MLIFFKDLLIAIPSLEPCSAIVAIRELESLPLFFISLSSIVEPEPVQFVCLFIIKIMIMSVNWESVCSFCSILLLILFFNEMTLSWFTVSFIFYFILSIFPRNDFSMKLILTHSSFLHYASYLYDSIFLPIFPIFFFQFPLVA